MNDNRGGGSPIIYVKGFKKTFFSLDLPFFHQWNVCGNTNKKHKWRQVFEGRVSLQVWLVASVLSIECKQSEQSIGVVAMVDAVLTHQNIPTGYRLLPTTDTPSSLLGVSRRSPDSIWYLVPPPSAIILFLLYAPSLHLTCSCCLFISLYLMAYPYMFRSSYSGVKLGVMRWSSSYWNSTRKSFVRRFFRKEEKEQKYCPICIERACLYFCKFPKDLDIKIELNLGEIL